MSRLLAVVHWASIQDYYSRVINRLMEVFVMRFAQSLALLCNWVALIAYLWTMHAPSANAFDFVFKLSSGIAPADAVETKSLDTALEAFNSGDVTGFQQEYEIACKKVPLPASPVFLGRLLFEAGKVNDAVATLEAYLASNLEDPEAYMALGFIASKTGRWTDAWLQFQQAQLLIEEGKLPESREKFVVPGLLELRAEVAEKRKQWEVAERLYFQLQELTPETGSAIWRAGRIRALAGKMPEAVQLMEQARLKTPELPCAKLTVALVLASQTDWFNSPALSGDIERWFQDSLRQDRGNMDAWREYLGWLLIQDRSSEVMSYLDKLPKDVLEHRSIQLLSALASRFQGQFAAAERILEMLVSKDPADLEAIDQLALVLIESPDEDKRAKSRRLADENLKANSSVESIVATAGWIRMRQGALAEADQILTQLASRGPMSPQSAFYVGKLLEKTGKMDEARAVYKLAVKSVGLFPQRQSTIQWLAKNPPNE